MRVTCDTLTYFLDAIRGVPVLAIDTETTGLEWKDRPFAMSIATRDKEFYLDECYMDPWATPIIEELVSMPRTLVFQNAKFDMRMLRHKGFHFVNQTIVDITVMARAENNQHMDYSLASQAKRAGMAQKQDDVVKKQLKEFGLFEERRDFFGEIYKSPRYDRVNKEIMEEYACHDVRLTYDLYLHYKNILDKDEKTQPLLEMEYALTKVCFEMEWQGVRLDVNKTMRYREYALESTEREFAEFKRITGEEYDGKPSQLARVFTGSGETFVFTEKGRPSFTDDVLEGFRSDAANVVRNIRHHQKRVSSFFNNLLNLQWSGVIHPTMWQAGTATGRFSYSDPNLQQVPKEDGDHPIRGCIIPREGKVLVSIDYKAQEFRMMLAYANQADLIEMVMAGHDPHQSTATTVGIERKPAKTLNFALIYGAGTNKIADMLGISTLESRALVQRYFMGLPAVDRFMSKVKTKAKTHGIIYTWLGRRLSFPDHNLSYKAPNALIQGGGADVTKLSMVNLYRKYGIVPLMQVHDQLVFEFDDNENLDKNIRRCIEEMEGAFPEKNGMRLEVDVTISRKSFAEEDQSKWPNVK